MSEKEKEILKRLSEILPNLPDSKKESTEIKKTG